MTYPGGKSGAGVYQKIISLMPPHKVYIECFLGGGSILRYKKPAEFNIGIEIDEKVIGEFWNEPLHKDFKIYCRDAFEILNETWFFNQGAAKETLIYLDPPYLESVRRTKRQIYRCDMMEESKHIELLQILVTLKNNVMISGYDSPLYNEMLSDWRKVSFTGFSRGGTRTETVWLNFPEPFELHDYSFLGENYRKREDIKRQKQRWISRLNKMNPQQRYAFLSAFDELKDQYITGRSAERSKPAEMPMPPEASAEPQLLEQR